MCTSIYFKHEKLVAGSIQELADVIGKEQIVVDCPDEYPPLDELMDGCLCPVDVAATMKPLPYHMTQWEDAFDWTARKDPALIEEERRAHDRARYEAAMAETRALRRIVRDSDTRPKDGGAK